MKLENGAFYGTYTAILRETCKERGVMACLRMKCLEIYGKCMLVE